MSFALARTSAALAALSAVAVLAPSAEASIIDPVTAPITTPVLGPILDSGPDACGYVGTQPFLPWHDSLGYVLTPNGGFESGTDGWTTGGGAAAVEGNETFQVAGVTDRQSLALPDGSSATSPPICVAKHDGVFRLFTKSVGERARLKVDVLYANGRRGKTSVLGAHDVWAPTRKLAVAIGRTKKGKEATATIAFRFTPLSGAWQIDDVYLDPRLRH